MQATKAAVLVNIGSIRDPCHVSTVNGSDTLTGTIDGGARGHLCSSFGRTNVCPRIDEDGSVALRTTIANRIACTEGIGW